MKPPIIAVTGVGAVIGYGVVRSIRNSPLFRSSRVIGLDTDPDSAGFRWCDSRVIPPRIGNEAYIRTLVQICNDQQVDILIPLIEDEFLPVHNAMHQFRACGTTVLIQPRSIVEWFMDKYLTYTTLTRAGIPTPETIPLLPENAGRITDLAGRHGWPLILKPRVGRSSKGVTLVSTRRQLDLYTELFKDQEYVVQEYVGADNREYTCTLFSVPALQEPYCIALERELAYGSTVKAQVIQDHALTDICRQIAAAFPLEGSLNIQMRKKDDIPHVFEINPRYSSTSYIRALCGFNDVEMGIRYFQDGSVLPEPEITNHRVVRYLDEILLPSGGGEYASGS